MAKRLTTLALALSFASAPHASAQNVDDFINLFGGLAQSAINKKAARKEWTRLPPEEKKCIDQALLFKGSSVRNLIRGGIRPSDPRLSEIRSNCRNEPPQSAPAGSPEYTSEATARRSPYIVDGLALGERVRFRSAAYRAYKCSPSEQFDDFTWCQRSRRERKDKRRVLSSNSVLHTSDGTTAYINRSIRPAFLSEKEAKNEVGRLSSRFGESARVQNMPTKQGLPRAIVASWGKVELAEIDAEARSILATGDSPRVGLLVDFLGDLHKSAKLGLPVYRLSGGAGYVWSASFDRKGIGHLRFLAVDAFTLAGGTAIAERKSQEAEEEEEADDEAPQATQQQAESPTPSPDQTGDTADSKPNAPAEATVGKAAARAAEDAERVRTAEIEAAKREAEAAKRETEVARHEAEVAKREAREAESAKTEVAEASEEPEAEAAMEAIVVNPPTVAKDAPSEPSVGEPPSTLQPQPQAGSENARPVVPNSQLLWEQSVADLRKTASRKWAVIRSNPFMAERLTNEYEKKSAVIFASRHVDNWNCLLDFVTRLGVRHRGSSVELPNLGKNKLGVFCRGDAIRYVLLVDRTPTNIDTLSKITPNSSFVTFSGDFVVDKAARESLFTARGLVAIVKVN